MFFKETLISNYLKNTFRENILSKNTTKYTLTIENFRLFECQNRKNKKIWKISWLFLQTYLSCFQIFIQKNGEFGNRYILK